jgi:hypothetical protein
MVAMNKRRSEMNKRDKKQKQIEKARARIRVRIMNMEDKTKKATKLSSN